MRDGMTTGLLKAVDVVPGGRTCPCPMREHRFSAVPTAGDNALSAPGFTSRFGHPSIRLPIAVA